ncbi:condensation domain-containing protein, partial [Gordonia aichiensis]
MVDTGAADDLLVVAAGQDGPALFVVDAIDPRVVRTDLTTMDLTRPQATVRFADAPARLLAGPAETARVCAHALRVGAAVIEQDGRTVEAAPGNLVFLDSTRPYCATWTSTFEAHGHEVGWSMGPLTRDLVAAYAARTAGAEPRLPALAVHYADYALWQTEGLGSAEDPDAPLAHQLAYWTDRLAGLPDVLTLPADRRRPLVASHRGATFTTTLDADLHRRIDQLARARRATPFMVLHAGLAVLLARLSAGTDIVVGTPVAGRGHRELDDIVGMFVNTLVLRASVPAAVPFSALLDDIRAGDLDAFDHADVPFESLVDAVNPARSQGYAPLYQVSLALQNQRTTAFELPGLTLSGLTLPDAPIEVDLDFTFVDHYGADGTADGLDLELRYATDLFDADTIATLVGMLERVLRAAVTAPGTAVG